jgi:hypothetical protein
MSHGLSNLDNTTVCVRTGTSADASAAAVCAKEIVPISAQGNKQRRLTFMCVSHLSAAQRLSLRTRGDTELSFYF